jgi:hypothetical protein
MAYNIIVIIIVICHKNKVIIKMMTIALVNISKSDNMTVALGYLATLISTEVKSDSGIHNCNNQHAALQWQLRIMILYKKLLTS